MPYIVCKSLYQQPCLRTSMQHGTSSHKVYNVDKFGSESDFTWCATSKGSISTRDKIKSVYSHIVIYVDYT